MIAIRRAGPVDLEILSPLYEAFFLEDAIAVARDDLRGNLAAMLADARAAIWIALGEGGSPAGLSSATLTRGAEMGLTAEIEDLYVVPGFRGQGLSRRLLETALAWAEAQGAREQFLVITPEAEAEQALTKLYARYGFRLSDRLAMIRSSEEPAP